MLNLLELIKVIILGIVEGITEFLPISSTGHLIVVGDLLKFNGKFASTFEIFIQLGAIIAVAVYYRKDLLKQLSVITKDKPVQRLWFNLFLAFLPAGIVGLLLHKWIQANLFSPIVVAISLIVGGGVLLWVERKPLVSATHNLSEVGWKQAIVIGVFQSIALIPGVSRSAATIVGGLLLGLDRETATGFSFYLALPTLGLATVFDLVTNINQLGSGDLVYMGIGLIVSFISAYVVVGWLLRYISSHNFRAFGFYRIAAGLAMLLWYR